MGVFHLTKKFEHDCGRIRQRNAKQVWSFTFEIAHLGRHKRILSLNLKLKNCMPTQENERIVERFVH